MADKPILDENVQIYRPYNLEKELIQRFLELKIKDGLKNRKIKVSENYFFSKETIENLQKSVSHYKGFNIHLALSEDNQVLVYLQPIGDGTGPIPGPGVGVSPAQ